MMKKNSSLLKLTVFLVCFSLFTACGVKEEPDASSDREGQNNQVSIHKDVMYVSFEDAMKVATNIMVGEYLGRSSSGCDGYEYRVLTQIKGRVDDDKICLHAEKHSVDVVGTDISYISDLQCDVGKTYMLVATRNVSVYQEHDIYIPVADIYIPLENVTGSTMYGQEKLTKHTLMSMNEHTQVDDLYNYIESYISTNPCDTVDYYGRDYVRSTEVAEVIAGSEYVMKVMIKELVGASPFNNTETYVCEIVKRYKGSVDTNIVEIMFSKGKVTQGQEHIVATNSTSVDSFMHLSSKNSVFQNSQEEAILQLIAE